MNKRTVLVLSTTMMSIATAACAFCVSQTANAAEKSVTTVESAVSTTKSSTPPPAANSNFTNTDASKESSLKTEGSSKKSEDSEISKKGDPKIAESTNDSTKPEVSMKASADKTETETAGKSEPNPEPASKPETKPKIDTKTKTTENNGAKTESSAINNQMFLASTGKPVINKPNPKPQQQQEKTELTVSLCWETMNKDNKNALINGNSDFGQLNFVNWDFGSTLDASRQDVKNAFANIQFKIKDLTDTSKAVVTTAGTYDSNNATSATKSLGSYDSSHTYEVSVVNSTIPSPYYVTYNNVSADEGKEFKGDISNFKWTPKNGLNKSSQNKYFRLNALEIVYAKDESVAANCFSYAQPQNTDGSYRSDGNWNFKYNDNNIFKRLRVDNNAIQFPKDKDGNLIHPVKAGFRFDGWQFYVAKKKLKNGSVRPYLSFDRMDDKPMDNLDFAYSPFGTKPYIDYPYFFALIRDNKGVNTFGSKLGTQYCTTNHTFVVFPKLIAAGHTVTFMNGDTQYAKVKVQENKSIDSDEWTDQSMPADPSKDGFTFEGWNEKQDGTGSMFLASTNVSGDLTVYSIFKDYPPVITVQNKTITEGESLDLNSLVVSATDKEDGDLKSSVQLTNNGGFDNTKVGSYKITFSVTDNGGASATAAATVTVAKKPPTPPTPPTPKLEPKPEPEPTPKPEPTPEPEPETEPVPDLFVPVEPIPQPIPVEPKLEPKSNPLPAPAPVPTQPEQPDQQKQPEAKHAAKHLPQTGSATTPILASAIASLFAGLAGFAESFAATRKRRN